MTHRCFSLVFWLAASSLSRFVSSAANADDVPGCGCRADTTCGGVTNGPGSSPIAACRLNQTRSGSSLAYNNTSSAPIGICDGLEADSDFANTIGNPSSTYGWFDGGIRFGPYYETGPVVYQIQTGTCDNLIRHQNSCPEAGNNNNNSENNNVLEYDPAFQTRVVTYVSVWLDPGLVSTATFQLSNNSVLEFSQLCRSAQPPERNTTAGHDDYLILKGQMTKIREDDRVTTSARAFFMSSLEGLWIEPVGGSSRRYASLDLEDFDENKFCLFVVSIGNEPCKGPPEASSSSASSSMFPSTKQGVVALLLVGTTAVVDVVLSLL